MHNTRIVSLLLAVASLWTTPAWSKTYPLPPADSRLIGELEDYIVQPGDHLELVGKHTQIGFLALLEANPGVDPYLPSPGTRLTLPTQMLLPDVPREGIVINLPELRLYYFPKGKAEVMVLPIGIGDIGRETPEMTTTVIAKNPNPTWVPGPPHGPAVPHGKTRRGGLVSDVADLIKDALILPQAFVSAMRGDSEQEFRERCVETLVHAEALDYMIDTLKAIATETGKHAA